MSERHVLVAGATGLAGRAAMQYFAERGVKVTAVSRRRPFDTYGARFVSLDLDDERACTDFFGDMADVTHVAFAALYEKDELVAGWLEEDHIAKNERMLRNLVEPLDRNAPGLKNITLLQGPKAYGVHVGSIPTASREDRDDRRDVPNFYWAQQDYITAKQAGRPWSWTILRPALVVGLAVGGAMNLVAAIGVYGAILRERGEPLHFPGGMVPPIQATDTDLMAHAFDWAGTSEAAANQVFNVTNGEVFSLRELWPVIAESLGMEAGDSRPMRFTEEMPKAADEWNQIREKYRLAAPDMASFIGQSFQFADFCFAHGVDTPQAGASVSCVKIRKAGFNDALYSDEMFRKWFARYQQAKLLPPPA